MKKEHLAKLSLDELRNFAKNKNAGAPGNDIQPDLCAVKVETPVLSFAQERLWFMDRLSPDNPFYNLSFCLNISGSLDLQAMQNAWRTMVYRHSCLRHSFPSDANGSPYVALLPAETIPLRLESLPAMTPDAQNTYMEQAIRLESAKPFSMKNGPLLRGTLFCRDKDQQTLLVTFHHSIFDGWSVAIFYEELFALYDSFAQGQAPDLSVHEATYEQYALWQRKKMTPDYLAKERDWWQKALRDLPELALRADAPRPAAQSFAGGVVEFNVDSRTVAAMDALAKENQATPFMSWLAVYSLMLSRFSGQVDFSVGCSVAGRDHPATEKIIGFFLNNLVVRLSITENSWFPDFLKRVRDTTLNFMEHGETPFQLIADVLDAGRTLDKNPLYQAGFVFQNTPEVGKISDSLELEPVPVPTETTHVDMELYIWPEAPGKADGLRCYLVYSSAIISRERAQNMAAMFQELAGEIARQPRTPVHNLVPPETVSILHGPKKKYPMAFPWQLFEQRLEHDATAAALILPEENPAAAEKQVSYAALAQKAHNLAGQLINQRITAQSIVSIILPSGPDQIAAMLAVWRQGCAWVPLEPGNPARLNLEILQDSGTSHVITTLKIWETLTHGLDVPPHISTAFLEHAVEAGGLPAPYVTEPADPACILYTSGSTGRPKGIVLSYEAMHSRLSWMWQELPWQAADRACQKTSPGFVDFLWEAFGAILAGVPLVMAGYESVRDVAGLMAIMERHRVTQLVCVPSLLKAMHEAGLGKKYPLASLKTILSSGEPLTPELVQKTVSLIPGLRVFNLYGSTEVMDATWHEAKPADTNITPIGLPVANTTVAILDDAMRPVPPGVAGNFYVNSLCVAHGYHGSALEKQSAFIPPVIPGQPPVSGRWFRMGDNVSLGEDGVLYYHGRRDQQLKIRGLRIEPGTITQALHSHPQVKEAVVIALSGDIPGNITGGSNAAQRLVAYVELTDAHMPTLTALSNLLRPHLATRIPSTMIPDVFIPISIWPRTPSGKISRQDLPSIQDCFAEYEEVTPAGQLETQVLSIWQTVLGINNIGLRDNFFEVGGTSLLIVSVHEKLQQLTGMEFLLTTLFQNPTVESFVAWLHRQSQSNAPANPSPGHLRAAPEAARAQDRLTARRMAREQTVMRQTGNLRTGHKQPGDDQVRENS